jgi:ketosteroid isomerase-like protein
MFERYTEKARRVIFFARYEASQYGSGYIETEHLLLGVIREGRSLINEIFGPQMDIEAIRPEIEKSITIRARVSTSVEVPLSEESKSVLKFAVEESDGLGKRHVGEEHLLLALLRVEKSRAAQILKAHGANLESIRIRLATPAFLPSLKVKPPVIEHAAARLHRFITRIGTENPDELAILLAKNAQVVDSSGVRWRGSDEIEKAANRIFAAYAQKNIIASVESLEEAPGQTFVASVLWQSMTPEGEPSSPAHRMTVVLAREGLNWVVLFLQATPVLAA